MKSMFGDSPKKWAMGILNAALGAMLSATFTLACATYSHAVDANLARLKSLEGQVTALTGKSDWTAALPLAQEAVEISSQLYGTHSIETADHQYRLGQTLRWLSKFDAARRVLGDCLSTRQKVDPASPATADALNELGWVKLRTAQLAEAERHFQDALTIRQRLLGSDHLNNAWALEGLVEAYLQMSKFADAERLGTEALRVKALHYPPQHNQVIYARTSIAIAQHKLGKLVEAENGLSEVLAARRASPDARPEDIATALSMIAAVNYEKGSFGLAEAQANEGLKLLEQIDASESATYFTYQSLLSKIYFSTSRYTEAEAAAIKVRDAFGRVAGLNARMLVDAHNSLGVSYAYQNRYVEAEQSLKKAIALAEQIYGENSLDVSALLENLSFLYSVINRPHEALSLFDRILKIRAVVLPPDHMLMGTAKGYRAKVLNELDRYGEAEQDARQAQEAIARAYSQSHPLALAARMELASALGSQKKFDEAIGLYEEAIQLIEAGEGAAAYRLAVVYHDLGLTLKEAGRLDEAEQALTTSLAHKRSDDEISRAQTLKVLAGLNWDRGRWDEALKNYRAATAIFASAIVRASPSTRQYEGGVWLRDTARGQLRALLEMAEGEPERSDGLAREGFELSQWLVRTSTTALAISQARARLATSNAELAEKARERQDLADRWNQMENFASRSLSSPIEQRNGQQQALLRGELSRLEKRLSDLDKELADAFPAFAELSGSRAISAEELQTKWLGADEALISFAEVGDHVVVWVVTRDKVHWHTSLGRSVLNRLKWRIGCRLNDQFVLDLENRPFITREEWSGAKPREDPVQACRQLNKSGFDVGEAYALYRFLLGPADDLIKDKQLLIATSGPILRVPFNALVATQPGEAAASDADRLRAANWLGTRNAIALIPSVSSLKALRLTVKAQRAGRPMIAFANPTLDGVASAPANELKRRIAAYHQNCGLPPSPEEGLVGAAEAFATSSLGLTSGVGAKDASSAVRALSPIPGTARLACGLANRRQFLGSTVLLGKSATEARVRALSNSGDLAENRVVHFATHGLRAGQVAGLDEPGLILTPGESKGPDDDGYLRVSEITTLKLNADWVILSACETAAGERGGESLSGLARAFFYAGAQALLVTNWAVYEEAAIDIVSSATQYMDDLSLGRAEALRRAMSDIITRGSDRQVNPAYWAPFVVVGEGSVARN